MERADRLQRLMKLRHLVTEVHGSRRSDDLMLNEGEMRQTRIVGIHAGPVSVDRGANSDCRFADQIDLTKCRALDQRRHGA